MALNIHEKGITLIPKTISDCKRWKIRNIFCLQFSKLALKMGRRRPARGCSENAECGVQNLACDYWRDRWFGKAALCTYVQDWKQVLFNQYFIFSRGIWHFHITSYLTELIVFWWLVINEDTLWCLSWAIWISLPFNPGHIWAALRLNDFFGENSFIFIICFLKVLLYLCVFICFFILFFICQSTFFILLFFSAEYLSRS